MDRGLIVDSMLGSLAKWLRLMGIDTLYVNESDISTIESLALKTGRIIITRTQKFKERKNIETVVLKEKTLKSQIKELIKKLNIKKSIKFLSRCSLCNSLLLEVEKERIEEKVPPYVFKTQDRFLQCPDCQKIYWQGTHYKNIKKRIESILISVLLLSLLFFNCAKKALYKTDDSGVPIVRVLIAEELTKITIFSSETIIVKSQKDRFNIKPLDTLSITINDRYIFPLLLSTRLNSPIFINGTGYNGNIKVYLDSELSIVNLVDMETYIKGVVPHEIGTRPLSELEVIKAQAVAARTYAFKHLNLNTKPNFDVVSTIYDQVYKGIQDRYTVSDSAVNETYGEIITYRGEPIEAKYSSTCGGRTSDATDNWGEDTVPYLRSIRDVPKFSLNEEEDAFCSISPLFKWSEKYAKKEFYSMLKKNLRGDDSSSVNNEIGNIKMFSLERNPRSKRITRLKIKTDTDEIILKGLDIRKVLKEGDKILWSNYFYIEKNTDTIFIKGHGAGHGCGMCQWGAIGMARKGYRYKEILKHYYRGTRVKRKY